MTELNMIDHMGYGIWDIYNRQRNRFLPLPDYDLSKPDSVRLTIYGSIVDVAYSQLLMNMTELPLVDVLALDRVQKRLMIDGATMKRLRRNKLIEGRKPNLFVSPTIAIATDTKVEYIRNRAQSEEYYAKLILDYLEKFTRADRSEIDKLLLDKLSHSLSEKQKNIKSIIFYQN